MDVLSSLHSAPVTAMCYNESADAVISTDEKGRSVSGSGGRWVRQLVDLDAAWVLVAAQMMPAETLPLSPGCRHD